MAHEPFRGTIPDDRLYCTRYDMWVCEEDGLVTIGATDFGIFLAGEIIAFTAKPKGAEVALGRGLGTVECAKTVLAVHAPLSVTLVDTNETAEDRPQLVNNDPYGAGWMVRGRPADWLGERGGLVDAAAYRRHVLSVEPEARLG